jgi:hypothetical protein
MARRPRKPSAEIIILPGVYRADVYEPVPDKQVLGNALRSNITDVIIIGRNEDGQLEVRSGLSDKDIIIGRLARAIKELS